MMWSCVLTLLMGVAALSNGFSLLKKEKPMEKLVWKTCDSINNAVFNITKLDVQPFPIELPGNVYVTMKGSSSREVKAVQLELDIEKHTIFGKFSLPCLMEVGSCKYDDVCDRLNSDEDFMIEAKQMLQEAGLPTDCPIHPSQIDIQAHEFELPAIPTGLAIVVDGKYTITAKVTEKSTGLPLACYKVSVEVAEKETEETCYFGICF